jgi:hypothetical protein
LQYQVQSNEENDAMDEELKEAVEYWDVEVKRARAYLVCDGAGLTGLNRQLANSKKTKMD